MKFPYKDYVLIYPHHNERVMLIRKQRPDWQKGKLNLVGGKVESTDLDFESAAKREFREETGLDILNLEKYGAIQGEWGRVHVFAGYIKGDDLPISLNDESVYWYERNLVLSCPSLIPNLKVIIPLCHCRVKGWVIISNKNDYELSVRLGE